MKRFLRGLATALILTSAPLCATAHAQVSVNISFDNFHGRLARYGSWVYSDRWGTVWQPGDVPGDFRPYDTGGHWENTDEYGWTWISDYDWGDVTFHYGRWVYDPDDGWLWMPGYVWSPAWVVWRSNNDYVGWMPMPPDDNFLSGRGDVGFATSWNDPDRYYRSWYGPGYGGGSSLWVFVNFGHVADRDFHRYAARRDQVPTLVRQTTNITNYTVVNNYVVNRGIDVQRVSRAAGRPIRPVAARSVIKHPDMVATVDRGNQIRAQMLHVAPRGMGKPNSAPPPPPAIINKLSDHAVTHFRGGGANGDQQNVRMNAGPPQDNGGERHAPGNTMNGPGNEQPGRAHRALNPEPPNGMKPGPDNGSAGPGGPHRMRGPHNPDSAPAPRHSFSPADAAPAGGPDNGAPNGSGHRPDSMTGPATEQHHRLVPATPGPDASAPIGRRGSETMGRGNGPGISQRREIGPPTMEGPGPNAQRHESAPSAERAPERHQEHGPKKEKTQNPPP